MDAAQSIFLIWRMMPFMLTSFFVISFFLNSNIANLVLFFGLVAWSTIIRCLQFIKGFDAFALGENPIDGKLTKCNIFYFGNPTSIPLSMTTYSFLLGYFSYVMTYTVQNISSQVGIIIGFILLGALTVAEIIHASLNCISFGPAILFTGLSVGIGILYAVATGPPVDKKLKKRDGSMEKYWYVPSAMSNNQCYMNDNSYKCNSG